MPKNTTQCPWPGLKPRLLNREKSALTKRPLHLHINSDILHINSLSLTPYTYININRSCSSTFFKKTVSIVCDLTTVHLCQGIQCHNSYYMYDAYIKGKESFFKTCNVSLFLLFLHPLARLSNLSPHLDKCYWENPQLAI